MLFSCLIAENVFSLEEFIHVKRNVQVQSVDSIRGSSNFIPFEWNERDIRGMGAGLWWQTLRKSKLQVLFISLSLWPEAIFFVFGVNGFQSHATFTDNHLITNPLCNGRAFSLASDLYQKVLAREEKYSHVKGLKFSNHILLTSDRGSHPTHPILDNQIINLRLRFSPLQRREGWEDTRHNSSIHGG